MKTVADLVGENGLMMLEVLRNEAMEKKPKAQVGMQITGGMLKNAVSITIHGVNSRLNVMSFWGKDLEAACRNALDRLRENEE